jgi:hypothetical protein
MNQDHKAEAKRREERVRTRDVAKLDEAAKTPKIDPERLSKAIRYLSQHPKRQTAGFRTFSAAPDARSRQ